jgi:single-strand DNA-binding protein
MSLNKVMLIGRLGKDPEVQHFDSGAIKASFSLATSESYTNKSGERVEQTEWHNVIIWGKQAEIADRYLRKGTQVYIEGKIKTRSWEDRDGNKRYMTEIEVLRFQMLGGRNDNENAAPSNSDSRVTADTAPKNAEASVEEVDDLPF